jgi:hypothetical protein
LFPADFGKSKPRMTDSALNIARTLLDLEPDVLLLCLAHVGASGLGHLVAVNKFFAILCAEHSSHTPFLASTVASGLGAAHAALEPQCRSAPSVGLFFSSEPLCSGRRSKTFSAELTRMAKRLPASAHMIGCNTHRIVTTQRDAVQSGGGDKKVALQLGHFPEATIGSFTLCPEDACKLGWDPDDLEDEP